MIFSIPYKLRNEIFPPLTSQEQIQEFIERGFEEYIPNISIDCTIFGYHERQLKVLLLSWKALNGWSLPGGRVKRAEALQTAAERILLERTGLSRIFLNQFYIFGDSPFRQKRPEFAELLKSQNFKIENDNWLLDRTLSVGYYALVEYSLVNPAADEFTQECKWFDTGKVPGLLFDHNEMIERALSTLRRDLSHKPVGYNLLPEKFSLPEIHELYETILGKKLDRRNFSKKLMAPGILRKLKETKNIGPHRSPFLYRFDKRNYEKALKHGLVLSF